MALQFIRNRKKNVWYVYAWKGGPLVMRHEGTRRPALNSDASTKLAKALAEREQQDTTSTLAVVRAWRSSPEWEALADGTKKVWRTHADRIEAEWGSAPVTIWNDPRMTAKVVQWRNKRKDTPRTADIGVTVLVAFLKWARLMGKGVTLNVASDIPQLYRGAQRQEIIWTEADMQAFEAASERQEPPVPHIVDGMRLAALTGLRRADLVTLTFAHVGEFAVTKTALKKSRGRRRRATIPMTPALDSLLAELRTRKRLDDCDTVLVNSFGRSWSGDGFGGSFNRIRDTAGISHVDDEGNVRAKHLHDLRGTFCTMLLAECELTDEQAGNIMGWSKDRVAQIRKVYVDGSRVVVAIGERIAANARAKQGAKQ